MLQINLTSGNFSNHDGSVMSTYLILEERGNTIKKYIDFLIVKNSK